MKCQYCGSTLPDFPEDAVEEDEIDEVVVHVEDGDEQFMVSKRRFYCDPKCLATSVLDKGEVEP